MGVSRLSAKQPWVAVWTPGVNLANFFSLYDSRGDITISTPTFIPTTLDGPIQVARYGALTVNAALTASQRCRGLIILSDARSTGAAGSVSMTARGAAGAKNWAVDKDIFVPQAITFSGKNTSYADFLRWIRTTGYCIFDPSLYACPPPGMGDVTCDWALWTPYGNTIISAAGCGLGSFGTNGSAGSNGGTGSGAAGGSYSGYSGIPAPGRPWGGGPGAAGNGNNGWAPYTPDLYGGKGGISTNYGGGGAGNPGGTGNAAANGNDGTGGVLIDICRGNVTLTAGHSLTSNGSAGGAGGVCGGGGSGAGSVSLLYGGTLTGTPNLVAAGGPAGSGSSSSGYAGGAGSTQAKSFATMGWAA